ncbi:MAG: MBL fold metallo-hydrolase [Thermoguttaceae bacterium]
MIGCRRRNSTNPNFRNRRIRCAVILGQLEGNLLIDTPPDLRLQSNRERIGLMPAVAYTHAHADHLFGLDDLRVLPRYLERQMPILGYRLGGLAYCTDAKQIPPDGLRLLGGPGVLILDGLSVPFSLGALG